MEISEIMTLNKTYTVWRTPDILLLVLRCRGRGDGVLTVRDGGSATVTLGHPSPLPPHCIPPTSRPAPHVIYNNPNSTIATLMSSGEEGRLGGTEEEGKRHQEVAASLSPSLFHPRLLLIQAGTPLPEMHSSASLWVEVLATRQSVKTLTDCVDEYQM